ncbi:MAG TPA: amino acid permease [Actinomycetota bacterium]|nr:amino acid permease [Actinomycetota bacterium]
MADATVRPGVFSRAASGLTREINPVHHWIYNVFTLLPLTGAAFFYLWAPGVYPGTDPLLGLVVATVAIVPIYAAYAMLASAMPRSGGDYVFQSRILHPAVAFTALFAQVIWLWYWLELSGFWISNLVASPLFSLLGAYTGTAAFLDVARWFSSQQGIFWSAIVTNAAVAAAFVPGLRTYLRVQWWLFAGVILSIVTMLLVLLTTTRAEFVARFNALMASFDPRVTDYYRFIIQNARENGLDPSAGGGLAGLLGVVGIAWFSLIWAVWSMMNLGEIKHAGAFRTVNRAMQLSLLFTFVVMAATMGLLIRVAGREFVIAAGFTWWNGTIDYPVLPYSSVLVAAMGGSALVAVLVLVGFLTQAVQQTWNVFIGGTRIIVAMSLDRLLPEAWGKVSRRFRGSPVNAILILLVGGELLAVLFLFAPDVESYALSTALAATLYQTLTLVAATVFPYRAPYIFGASPIARYRIGDVPVISVLGAWGVFVGLVLLFKYLTDPGLGLRPLPGETLFGFIGMLAVYLVALVWFFVWRSRERRRGIDVDLNFRMLPPE